MGLALIAITLLAGCSSVSVTTDFNPGTDFTGYSTYAWMPNPARATDPRVNNDLMDQRFRAAIETALESKGMRHSETNPDVRVGYIVALDDRVEYDYDYVNA